jgi:hypothetical protein
MTEPTDFHPREADETAAPVVIAYTLGVVAAIAGLIAWVFWFRGYA